MKNILKFRFHGVNGLLLNIAQPNLAWSPGLAPWYPGSMTNIDQFESIFKKADKTRFQLEDVDLNTMMVVTDDDHAQTDRFNDHVIDLLDHTLLEKEITWHKVSGDQHTSVNDLLEIVDRVKPDLICTYRNLHAPASDFPYSLGVYIDVLSQVTEMPVLVLPSPHRSTDIPTSTDNVMAIADHLTGDHHLVSYAARLTSTNGRLFLSHVEDEVNFERYMNVIGKIPSIETEAAREAIQKQLLAEPHDYIRSCVEVLKEAGLPIQVEEIVTLGHSLRDYERLIEQHKIDLLVVNTKQEDQLAMHGLAYPLCVELRDTPILML